MADSRPLASIRPGAYDDPPAADEASTPRTRRTRLQRALQSTNDLARDAAATAESPRRTHLAPIMSNRRRQRWSQSPPADFRDPAYYANGDDGARHRPKRRRLESTAYSALPTPIKYGQFGQVEPGTLRLDIISCDGGEHVDSRNPHTYLGAKNLLRHDKSVYCSERPCSNIILRHADDTPFCLEKLHVVAPEHGFTAPVREGVVYVAMTLHDLQKYLDPPPHARRSDVPQPSYRSRFVEDPGSLRSSPERLTLSDALRDPVVNAALEQRAHDYARGADAAHDLAVDHNYHRNLFANELESQCEIPSLSSIQPDSEFPDVQEQQPAMPITVLSDDEPGPEETSTQEVLDYRLHRLRLMRRRHEMETWDRNDRWAGFNTAHPTFHRPARSSDSDDAATSLSRLDGLMARSDALIAHSDALLTQARTEQADALPPLPPLHGVSGLPPSEPAHDDPAVTSARFQIRGDRHRVAICFEPAVSGRFVLLKLWSGKGNVDVQSVIAKGYGGCRFFPAREVL